ncbi:MarR family winged helix-turn-helix transcriptional regulator [Actinomadura opuntiae]|uniref:MarR family winged helix-turn-helix transcriptional regulator n=1 Tax=Actinomadura sp. OS1-43 TaxID=604315 RepID=UPI00255ABD62|nr:MarR family transcriptional regulator [Actinomadura sp. OS1-43]MDL4814440.1 MarR family transcriptional regulator [Actinomadura sp. OS1-43]
MADNSSSTPGVSPLEEAARALMGVWHQARRAVAGHLSPVQLDAMEIVADVPGITLGQLAEELQMLPSSASRLCGRLETASLLRRAPGRADRRRIALHLTADGTDLLNDLRRRRSTDLQAVLEHMTGEERDRLQNGLDAFARHAGRRVRARPRRPAAARLTRLHSANAAERTARSPADRLP